MKRLFLLSSLLLVSLTSLISCREEAKEKEVIVREVEVEKPVEVKEERRKGVLERTAEEVDKEVNKEINEEIEKIGDDN